MQDDATLQAEEEATSMSSNSAYTKGLDNCFDSCTSHLLADFLKHLVVMGIDKCTSQCLVSYEFHAPTRLRDTSMKLPNVNRPTALYNYA